MSKPNYCAVIGNAARAVTRPFFAKSDRAARQRARKLLAEAVAADPLVASVDVFKIDASCGLPASRPFATILKEAPK